MDLKVYYRKVREVETSLTASDLVVVSLETPDGGAGGIRTEVRRATAARMIVEGKARLATDEEAAEFREQARAASKAAEQAAAAGRVQLAVVSDAELRALRGALKKA